MAQEFKYQESLDLFESIYFNMNGNLEIFGWDNTREDHISYKSAAKVSTEQNFGKSKIVGRSAFTPRIIDRFLKKCLTLDKQGKFNHGFGFYNKEKMLEIDITGMNLEEILTKTREILTMSNEEIMKKFDIKKTYGGPQIKLELLVDDIIQDYLIENGLEVTDSNYDTEKGISIRTQNGEATQTHGADNDSTFSCVVIKGNDLGHYYSNRQDEIYYKVLSGEDEYEDIRVAIDEDRTKVQTALGNKILETLRERFKGRDVKLNEGELQVLNRLGNLSMEELEHLLRATEVMNTSRIGNLEPDKSDKKGEIIKKIIQAQEEGKKLDAQIKEAKAMTSQEKQ